MLLASSLTAAVEAGPSRLRCYTCLRNVRYASTKPAQTKSAKRNSKLGSDTATDTTAGSSTARAVRPVQTKSADKDQYLSRTKAQDIDSKFGKQAGTQNTVPSRRIPLTEKSWPWREIRSRSPQFREYERIIFARPPDTPTSPNLILFGWILASLASFGLCFMLDDHPPNEEVKGRLREKLGRHAALLEDGITTPIRVGGSAALLGVMSLATFVQSKGAIRLSLIRKTPISEGSSREVLRVSNTNHLIHIPFTKTHLYPAPKDLDPGKCSVFLSEIMGKRRFIEFRTTDSLLLPRRYRLNYSSPEIFQKVRSQDIVLSFDRLEAVFGEIGQPGGKWSKEGSIWERSMGKFTKTFGELEKERKEVDA